MFFNDSIIKEFQDLVKAKRYLSTIQKVKVKKFEKKRKRVNVKNENQDWDVFTDRQRLVLKMIKEGKNVFYTGPWKSGKSKLISTIKEVLYEIYKEDEVFVTATTGKAASLIGGITLHKFAGISGFEENKEECLKNARIRAGGRWKTCKVLIIDEVSMLLGDLFDLFSGLGEIIRRNEKPWGGIQIICTGEFLQLPPVKSKFNKLFQHVKYYFAFQSDNWRRLFTAENSVYLDVCFANEKEEEFVKNVNKVRLGINDDEVVKYFKSFVRNTNVNKGLNSFRLCPTNILVNKVNEKMLRLNSENLLTYKSYDFGIDMMAKKERINKSSSLKDVLLLKKNSPLILKKNVNSLRGVVVGYGVIDRLGIRREEVKKWVEINGNMVPIVRFEGLNDNVQINPVTYKVDGCSRTQIPFNNGYCSTIHNSQGSRYEIVVIGGVLFVFECGHTYVAISRVEGPEGLYLDAFEKKCIIVNKDVLSFMEKTFGKEIYEIKILNKGIAYIPKKKDIKLTQEVIVIE